MAKELPSVLCTAPGCDEEAMPNSPYCCRSCMAKAKAEKARIAAMADPANSPEQVELNNLNAQLERLTQERHDLQMRYDRLHRKHSGIVRD